SVLAMSVLRFGCRVACPLIQRVIHKTLQMSKLYAWLLETKRPGPVAHQSRPFCHHRPGSGRRENLSFLQRLLQRFDLVLVFFHFGLTSFDFLLDGFSVLGHIAFLTLRLTQWNYAF